MTIEFKNGVPTFFKQAPTICLRDPLAAFLGATEGGLMTYSYQDAVKLAGHSCLYRNVAYGRNNGSGFCWHGRG